MSYDLRALPISALISPVSAATGMLERLDERLKGSVIGKGCIARAHFADAAASMWIGGELVHVEDLVLHDVGADIRAPTHELSIARDILRTRRRIASQPADWALSAEGLKQLRGGPRDQAAPVVLPPPTRARSDNLVDNAIATLSESLDISIAEMDKVLARTQAILSGPAPPQRAASEKSALLYEPDWDEDERLKEWQAVLLATEPMPPVLRSAVLLDAWNALSVSQHARWLGPLLGSSLLRETGVTTYYLCSLSWGLKGISLEQRASRDRDIRILGNVEGIRLAAANALREHDRLLLARQQMHRRLIGRRQNSKLPQLIDLVIARPVVSSGMIADELGVTIQGALKLTAELNLRELTGRGRFRAWGVL